MSKLVQLVHMPTAQTRTPTTKHAAMRMRMFFFRPFTIDRNVDVAALFGAAAGHNLHNLQGIACTIRHGLSSGQLKQPQLHSLQPTQIIHDPGS